MKIKKNDMISIINLINKMKNRIFNVETQYKLLKLKRKLQEEQITYEQEINDLSQFIERENGKYIKDRNGGYKIYAEKQVECEEFVKRLNSLEVQLPEIYFSLDELENLQLSLEDLEILMPFIK